MILNALDEVLFWEDISLLSTFTKNIVAKYYPHDPENYFKEKERFMEENIPDKSDFTRRIEYYTNNGAPIWVSGRSGLSEDITSDDLQKAILINSTEQNGKNRAGMAAELIAKNPEFWKYYTNNILYAEENTVCELTIGAGLGTAAVMREMKECDLYVGVDIDFLCAKNADAIAKYLGVNGLGITASLWNMPFEDEMFTAVCCNQGLEECREISTILSEASRILKESGRLILRCKNRKASPWYLYFAKYGFSADETCGWLRRLRLYSEPEQVEELAAENRLRLLDKKDDNGIWTILMFEKY